MTGYPSLTRSASMRDWWDDPLNAAVMRQRHLRRNPYPIKPVTGKMVDGRDRAKHNERQRRYDRQKAECV